MKRYSAVILLLVAALAPWATASACSCARAALPSLYESSKNVFLAEVIEIELTTPNPVHGEKATYVAIVNPVETFKGSPSAGSRVTFTATYAEPGRPPPNQIAVDEATGSTLTLVGGCDFGMSLGRYYIFEKQDEPLRYGGWCTERVMYQSIIILDFMRQLRDAK